MVGSRLGSGPASVQFGDADYLINETRRRPPTGTRCPIYTLSVGSTGSFILCPVAQTRLDIPRPLFTQSWLPGPGGPKFSGTRQIRTAHLYEAIFSLYIVWGGVRLRKQLRHVSAIPRGPSICKSYDILYVQDCYFQGIYSCCIVFLMQCMLN